MHWGVKKRDITYLNLYSNPTWEYLILIHFFIDLAININIFCFTFARSIIFHTRDWCFQRDGWLEKLIPMYIYTTSIRYVLCKKKKKWTRETSNVSAVYFWHIKVMNSRDSIWQLRRKLQGGNCRRGQIIHFRCYSLDMMDGCKLDF